MQIGFSALPQIILLQKEIKICQGCIQSPDTGVVLNAKKRYIDLTTIGILDCWFIQVPHGSRMEEKLVVRHEPDHCDCYNYTTRLVEQILELDVQVV